ncbi:MAG: UxaA family hydrolase, partial [Beijerinckiaceae bacterium]
MDSQLLPRFVRLAPTDNVVVSVDPFQPGARIEQVTASERVPRGHKMASSPIAAGAPVRKFGQIIGFAKSAIQPGQWIHEHNCGMDDVHGAFGRDYRFAQEAKAEDILAVAQQATFQGYRRSNGK